MFFLRISLLLPLAVVGLVVPARAQGPITFPLDIPAGSASASKTAYLLDPAHNPAPNGAFALWPGLPLLKDLSPQAARLFVPPPAFAYHLPAGIGSVMPTQGNEEHAVTAIYTTNSPNVDMGPGTPLGNILSEVAWLGQTDKPTEVAATLWRFTDEIQEPFAGMLKDWDGKTPLIRQVDREDVWKVPITGNYYKSSPKYHLTSGMSVDMEFHSALASEHRNPALPQDHVRITVVRPLREGENEMRPESRLSALIDSPGQFWEPVLVPQFSPDKDLVVLLPENHDKDGVKATFLQFHLFLPGRG